MISLRSQRLPFAGYLRSSLRAVATSVQPDNGIRDRLLAELKSSMKSKDAVTSSVLRGVLSEVYAADKQTNEKVNASTITSILRKAKQRRDESATEYTSASRPELADKERLEGQVLEKLLPPQLSDSDIDAYLRPIVHIQPRNWKAGKRLGTAIKAFYHEVDPSMVDGAVVTRRVNALLTQELQAEKASHERP